MKKGGDGECSSVACGLSVVPILDLALQSVFNSTGMAPRGWRPTDPGVLEYLETLVFEYRLNNVDTDHALVTKTITDVVVDVGVPLREVPKESQVFRWIYERAKVERARR